MCVQIEGGQVKSWQTSLVTNCIRAEIQKSNVIRARKAVLSGTGAIFGLSTKTAPLSAVVWMGTMYRYCQRFTTKTNPSFWEILGSTETKDPDGSPIFYMSAMR